ncbi:MAG: hypothetical protein Q9207_006513 [Kuettlingeria erythrocarpa]
MNLTYNLQWFALPLISCYKVPLRQLDEAITSTRNQNHVDETLINANELFYLYYMDESINMQGLIPLERYNRELERVAQKPWPSLERSLALLLSAHDDYGDLFKMLDEIGLAHYADPLKQIVCWRAKKGTAKHKAWGLLYSIRFYNILLHERIVSYIPPQDFLWRDWNQEKTFFTSLPFRHPTTKAAELLGLSKEEYDTRLFLALEIHTRRILIPPPDAWAWEHALTANITLRPFPSRIPCPRGLMYAAGSASSFLCNES